MTNQTLEQLKKENEELKAEIQRLKDLRNNQKRGMIKKASKGKHISRPAFGYNLINKELVPAENFREVEDIFREFLEQNISLTQLAKRHNISINGLKKILKNFTYVGKVKFDGQINEGNHKPLISSILFNQVQDKLDKLKIK